MKEQTVGTGTEIKAISVNGVLPDSEIDWLLSLGQRWKDEYWRIGDDINVCKASIRQGALYMTMERLYWQFSTLTGGEKSERTMRYLAQVADHYPAAVGGLRYQYPDVPHYFFGIIMRYPGYEAALLQSAQTKIDELGRSPGEAWLYSEAMRLTQPAPIDEDPPEMPLPEKPVIIRENWQDLPIANIPKTIVRDHLQALKDLEIELTMWEMPARDRCRMGRLIGALKILLERLEVDT